MKNIIAVFILAQVSCHFLYSAAFAGSATKEKIKVAEQTLKKLGIDKRKVKLSDSMDWQHSCFNGILEEGKKSGLTFFAQVTKNIRVKGLSLEKNAKIWICDEAIVGIEPPSEDKEYSVDGYACGGMIGFSKKGQLCKCWLSKPAVIDGIKIARGGFLYLQQGKPYSVVISEAVEGNGSNINEVVYRLKEGKLVRAEQDSPSCNYEE